MNDCIFCNIVAKKIPADIIYEDENFLAFLDINPVQKGHLLIVPKQHITWIQDMPDDLLSANSILMKKMIQQIIAKLSCDYVHVVIEGIEVAHVHTHLIPSLTPIHNAKWNHVKYDPGEQMHYAEILKG